MAMGKHCLPKIDKEAWATSGNGYLYMLLSTISTARRQVTMKRIVCTIEGAEMLISINMVDRPEVMIIKTMEIWRGGGGQSIVVGKGSSNIIFHFAA